MDNSREIAVDEDLEYLEAKSKRISASLITPCGDVLTHLHLALPSSTDTTVMAGIPDIRLIYTLAGSEETSLNCFYMTFIVYKL
ncbi:hypothetical protein [Photobacterium leiognathi]|uniref:hypothetical protein n=1 Tax=Photobacterium leiognathi TaxID=553611 RepID=UPI0029813FEE|nr:hypothetical protein [Photobacterium leiognathi]